MTGALPVMRDSDGSVWTRCWAMRPSEAEDSRASVAGSLFREGLEENDPVRLGLIDMEMPGDDGEALQRAIRVDHRLADTRTVMLTCLGARDDTRRFHEIGVDASLYSKPIRHLELLNALGRALSGTPGSGPRPIVALGAAGERQPSLAGVNARILLAEDNVVNQQVALSMLRKLGHTRRRSGRWRRGSQSALSPSPTTWH